MTIVVGSVSPAPRTVLDIIKRAMRLLGVYAIGEDPSADEAQTGLTAFQTLIESMSNENLMVYAKTEDAIPLAQGQQTITVGPTGDYVTARPVHVMADSYIQLGSVSYPLALWTEQQYNSIGLKGMESLVGGIWVQYLMPDVKLHIYPVPSQAMTLHLWSAKQIASDLTLTTDLVFPPGYDRLFALTLAEELAPEFQVEPSVTLVRKAAAARRVLKRTNAEIPQMGMPYGVPPARYFLDIRQF